MEENPLFLETPMKSGRKLWLWNKVEQYVLIGCFMWMDVSQQLTMNCERLSQGGVNPGVFRVNDVNLLSHFAISRSFLQNSPAFCALVTWQVLNTCSAASCVCWWLDGQKQPLSHTTPATKNLDDEYQSEYTGYGDSWSFKIHDDLDMWIYHDFTVVVQNHDKTTLPFRICFVLFRFALGSRGLLGVGGLWGIGDPSQIFCPPLSRFVPLHMGQEQLTK